jgi:hypothetical protein
MPGIRSTTCAMYRLVRSIHPATTSRRSATVLVVLFGVSLMASAQRSANPFRNIRNEPFAAVSNGPQGAIVVRHDPRPFGISAFAMDRAVRTSIAQQHSPYALSQAVAALRFRQQHGLTSPRAELRVPRIMVHTMGDRLILPDLERARQNGTPIGDPNNNITFEFEGFSSGDEATFAAYLDRAMPVARALYGPPAFNITVKVINDPDIEAVQGGIYDVTTNELRFEPIDNVPEDTFVLILLVLNAFRDDVALFYDSWEQGMTGAAATAIHVSPGVAPNYDPVWPNPYYSGSVYDPQNLPPLGNSTWYPASGFSGMLALRIAQARAAWFKCYTEDSRFFSRFNAQYYARLNALSPAERAALPGDTPSLLEICRAVLPTVEGQSFFSWYRQQYVLDTSISVGPKLYVWNTPLTISVMLIAEYYETTPTGDELALSGTARLNYWNYDFSQTLYAQEGYEIEIPPPDGPPGQGYLLPTFYNIGGPQRITIQVDLNGLWGRYPFPYGMRWTSEEYRPIPAGENNFYGAIIGPNEGTINVVGLDGLSDVEVKRGVWGGSVSSTIMSPAQLEVTFEDANGNRVTRKINVAFDDYDVLLTAGATAVVSKHLPYASNGLYLFSLPILPLVGDPAAVLGIPAEKLMLARWDPRASGGGKYEFYPTIDPFRPGLGYWLRILDDVTIAAEGVLPGDRDDAYASLFAGWNMVGCARNADVSADDLLVQRGAADSQPFGDAAGEGWVQAGIWGFDQQNGYKLVSQLQPFGAYWVRCLLPEGVTLVFPELTTASLADRKADRPAAVPLSKTTWHTALVLDCGGVQSEAFIGAAASAQDGFDARYDIQSPPAFGEWPTLRFAQPDWGPDAGQYASDIRPRSFRGPWRLKVAGVRKGVRARLRWPDLSALPSDFRPVLTDLRTGRRVYMRTASSYAFAGSGTDREFEVRLDPSGAQPLGVVGLLGVQTRQGVAITYTLSTDAAVSVHVMNLAGRPVRELVRGKEQAAGRSTLLWDLRNSGGSPVPAGSYLIAVTVRSDDGQSARAVSQVTITR